MEPSNSNPFATPADATVLPRPMFSSEEDGITLEFETNQADLEQFYHFQHLHNPNMKAIYQQAWLRVTALTAIMGIALLQFSMAIGIGMLILSVFYGVCYPWLYRRRAQKTVKLILSKGRNLGMLGGRRLRLTRQGLYVHTVASEAILYWPTFEMVNEFKDALYLYISAASAIIIPGRVFESPEQRQECLQFIARMRGDAQATAVD